MPHDNDAIVEVLADVLTSSHQCDTAPGLVAGCPGS